MADKKKKAKEDDVPETAKPGFDPKPVQLGGESLLDRVLPHMKKIVIGIVLAAAVLTVIFTVRWIQERGRQKETEKLAHVLDVAERPVRPAEAPAPDPKKKTEPTFANQQERAMAVLSALAQQGTTAAGPTYRASLLVEAGKLDDAIAEYKKGIGQVGLDGVLAREGLGLAQEMKAEGEKDPAARQKGLEEALATFKTMQPDDKGPRAAYAHYHQGRMLGLLGKNADAKTELQKAKDLGKDAAPELAELVDERLASLGAS